MEKPRFPCCRTLKRCCSSHCVARGSHLSPRGRYGKKMSQQKLCINVCVWAGGGRLGGCMRVCIIRETKLKFIFKISVLVKSMFALQGRDVSSCQQPPPSYTSSVSAAGFKSDGGWAAGGGGWAGGIWKALNPRSCRCLSQPTRLELRQTSKTRD